MHLFIGSWNLSIPVQGITVLRTYFKNELMPLYYSEIYAKRLIF